MTKLLQIGQNQKQLSSIFKSFKPFWSLLQTQVLGLRIRPGHLTDFHFIPIGAETLGPFGPHAVQFLEDLGNKISQINGERRSKSFLFQSIGIAIQQGNASCVMGTTGSMGKLEELNYL